MKTAKIAALALLLVGALGGPAPAATVDYALSIPLVDIDATDLTPTSLLTGTLSYDDDAMSGSGIFSLVGSAGSIVDSYAGFAALLPLDDVAIGVLFDGFTAGGAELYFNIAANLAAGTDPSGMVNFCSTGCAMFTGVGATLKVADGSQDTPPGGTVSPVPLPPAVSLFGGALLALAGLGAGRRLAPRVRVVANR